MEKGNTSVTKEKEICRLCLTYDGLMRSIFDSDVTESSDNCLPFRISSCLSIKVSTNDQLPNKICHRCLFKVDMFFEFKAMCLNSDATLKNSLKCTSSKNRNEEAPEATNDSENQEINRVVEDFNQNRDIVKGNKRVAEIDDVRKSHANEGVTDAEEDPGHYLDTSEVINMTGTAEELKVEVSVTNFELMEIKEEESDVEGNDSAPNSIGHQDHHPRLNDSAYSSQECWKNFSSSVAGSAEEKQFVCDLCPSSFGRSSQLMRHRASKHTHEEDNPFRCPICGRTFSDAYSHSRHSCTHPGLRSFACPRSFSRHSNLVDHLSVGHHNQEQTVTPLDASRGSNSGIVSDTSTRESKKRRNFTCELCSKTFSDSYTLQRHGRTHTGERPYPCSMCGKTFSRSWSLARHVLLHTGERPHCCPLCGKRFADRSHLLRHVRTHGRAAAVAESKLRVK